MEKIVLLGSGGHAKSVVDAIEAQAAYEIVGFTDSLSQKEFTYRGYGVLGTDDCLEMLYASGIHHAFVCVGYLGRGTVRNRLYAQLKEIGFIVPAVIDPTAIIASDAAIGAGTFVGKRTVVNAAAKIGEMVILNTGSIVEHDCVVGAFSHVAVGAVLCGGVHLGEGSMIGANATVIQGVTLPENSFVKSGSMRKG